MAVFIMFYVHYSLWSNFVKHGELPEIWRTQYHTSYHTQFNMEPLCWGNNGNLNRSHCGVIFYVRQRWLPDQRVGVGSFRVTLQLFAASLSESFAKGWRG